MVLLWPSFGPPWLSAEFAGIFAPVLLELRSPVSTTAAFVCVRDDRAALNAATLEPSGANASFFFGTHPHHAATAPAVPFWTPLRAVSRTGIAIRVVSSRIARRRRGIHTVIPTKVGLCRSAPYCRSVFWPDSPTFRAFVSSDCCVGSSLDPSPTLPCPHARGGKCMLCVPIAGNEPQPAPSVKAAVCSRR